MDVRPPRGAAPAQPELSFSQARQLAAAELLERETAVFPHYSLLEGPRSLHAAAAADARKFRPLHRDSCGFPSPVELFAQLGVRDGSRRCQARGGDGLRQALLRREGALALPTFSLQVVDRRPAAQRAVYDLAVDDLHAFVAGTVACTTASATPARCPSRSPRRSRDDDLVVAAVLSGNRNFEGRIHPQVRAAFWPRRRWWWRTRSPATSTSI